MRTEKILIDRLILDPVSDNTQHKILISTITKVSSTTARLRLQLRLRCRVDRDGGRVQRRHVAHRPVQPPGRQGEALRRRLPDGREAALRRHQEHRGRAGVLPRRDSAGHAGGRRCAEEPGMSL